MMCQARSTSAGFAENVFVFIILVGFRWSIDGNAYKLEGARKLKRLSLTVNPIITIDYDA